MSRLTGPKCKLCRAEGIRLYLKGSRCESAKCPFSRSDGHRRLPAKPGAVFGQRRRRQTEYGRQLREKQKLKRFYGCMERQFQNCYRKASRLKGNVGVNMLVLFERRLDNALCLSGIASSRSQARQFINHGFVYVNDHCVDIPSYVVREGEEFQLHAKGKGLQEQIKENLLLAKNRETPGWIDLSGVEDGLKFKITATPTREQVSAPVNEQLVIELCSR